VFPRAELALLPLCPAHTTLTQLEPAPGTETSPLPWASLGPVQPQELLWG